jgi:hypothetical protein
VNPVAEYPNSRGDDGDTADAPAGAVAGGWSRDRQHVAIVLWPGFLAAATATLLFFAVFDPTAIVENTALEGVISNHEAGYAAGFFFFWVLATGSSALTLYLARTQPGELNLGGSTGSQDRP